MTEYKEDRDAIWQQLEGIIKSINSHTKSLEVLNRKVTKLVQKMERLEDKLQTNPARVIIEFATVGEAEEFKEYVREEKDVAIPQSNRMLDDKFIPVRLIEDEIS